MGANLTWLPQTPSREWPGRTKVTALSRELERSALRVRARKHCLRESPLNAKQNPTSSYILEENKKHLVPFAGLHSERKVGSTFDCHKRESYAEKSHIRVTLPETKLNVCLVLDVLTVET